MPEVPATTVQLWPEHFDAATTLTLRNGRRVNVGVSPGDSFEKEPYLYVGPWEPVDPGDSAYFNAPFGAVCTWSNLQGSADPAITARHFVDKGLTIISTASS
jgi:hypothetical protein